MRYLDRPGDMQAIADMPSLMIFDQRSSDIPRFGFIVPTYKRADLLQYALESILSQQTEERFEILVVDDNPERNDETEVLMTTRFNLPGIVYYKNMVNHRQENNWNKLFLLSRTEWVIMLHDDDMLYPDYMPCMLKAMKSFPKSIGGFFPSFFGHTFNDNILPERTKPNKIKARIIKETDFIQGNVIGAPLGMCVRRDIIEKIGGVNRNSSVAVDYDFFNRLVRETNLVKMYGYPLGIWRILDNVSQKVDTVLYCIDWGDVLKKETLEDCGLGWLMPFYNGYLRAFANQHIESWYKDMGKGTPERSLFRKCSLADKCIFYTVRFLLRSIRMTRCGNKSIDIE